MTKDYLRLTDAQLIIWLLNFKAQLDLKGASLGLSPDEITNIKAKCDQMIAAIEAADEAKRKQKSATTHKTDVLNEGKKATRLIVNKLKVSDNYTEAIGDEMGIIGESEHFDHTGFKPEIKLRRVSNGVELSFVKSRTDGINIYRRIEGETDWHYIARDTRSPYIDTDGMNIHATYEYQVWAVINDHEIGIVSDIAKFTI